MALTLASNAVIFSYSISLEYLILEDLVANASTTANASASIVGCTNAILQQGSKLWQPIPSYGWIIA